MKFVEYSKKISGDTDVSRTHVYMSGGKLNITDDDLHIFYEKYLKAIQKGEKVTLAERVTDVNFKFFVDLDGKKPNKESRDLDDTYIQEIVSDIQKVILEIYEDKKYTEYVISKRLKKSIDENSNEYTNNYHINFYNLVVDCEIAKYISKRVNNEYLDESVYRTAIRVLGSYKSINDIKENNMRYRIYELETGEFIEYNKITLEQFLQTTVRVTANTEKTIIKNLNVKKEIDEQKELIKNNSQEIILINNSDTLQEIKIEIQELFKKIKNEKQKFANIDFDVINTKFIKNRRDLKCCYVSIAEKTCPFKNREHRRASYPIYVEISGLGVKLRCYDEECQICSEDIYETLPVGFEKDFKQLWLSTNIKYWNPQVTMTEHTKKRLETSLTGTHYKIAEVAYDIYKSRFRVDDIKNTTWYEFDGNRWKQSYSMNILISADLPRYYRAVKMKAEESNKANNDETDQDEMDKLRTPEEKEEDKHREVNFRNKRVENICMKLENYGFKNSILNQLSHLFKNKDPDFVKNLDANPYLIGFKNGVYDLENAEFRKSDPLDYITYTTGYEYIDYDENNEKVKEIYGFLKKIITNDKVREYLLKVLGKSLVGIPDEKFYLWTGLDGANGKSTLINFLELTLGDYTTSVDVSLLTNKRMNSGNASPDVIRLRGRRLFTFQEPEHDDKLRTGILKQFTGGDTVIARELFKSPISFKLQGTMVMCCNELPKIDSVDGGTWRRIKVIEFNSRFCENPKRHNEFKIDPDLRKKMKSWKPYFMSILLHWYKVQNETGIQEPEEVNLATNKYKDDNDKFNDYFDECLDTGDEFIATNDIYNHFKNWWYDNNATYSKCPEKSELKRNLEIKYGKECNSKQENGKKHKGFYLQIINSEFAGLYPIEETDKV
jgi:P4 family phage/plasmid primase-like protien